MTDPQFIIRDTKSDLNEAIAERLVVEISAAQQARGIAHLVLTGGSMGGGALAALKDIASTQLDRVNWSTVHFWWGDERFVELGDDERNDTQARAALLDHVAVPAENVHIMAPSDGPSGDDADGAADEYAAELARYATRGETLPAFDVLMLGVGPDAHVASLFPHHPAQRIVDAGVIAVRDSPKPPPVRISLSYTAIGAARQVWLLVSGEEKAAAVAHACSPDADRWDYPASGARGGERTIWWLDSAAAALLPQH